MSDVIALSNTEKQNMQIFSQINTWMRLPNLVHSLLMEPALKNGLDHIFVGSDFFGHGPLWGPLYPHASWFERAYYPWWSNNLN